LVETLAGAGDQPFVVGQTEIVVGAEIEHRPPVFQADMGILRCRDSALGLPEPVGADAVEGLVDVVEKSGGHAAVLCFSALIRFPGPRSNDFSTSLP
jgi:hypothetical protein